MSKQPEYNPRSIILVRSIDLELSSNVPAGRNGVPKVPAADIDGVLLVKMIGAQQNGDQNVLELIELGDDDINDNTVGVASASFNFGFNDQNNSWDRQRTANTDDMGRQTGLGVLLTNGPGQFFLSDAAAVNTQATVTRAAPGANLRHIVQAFSASISGIEPSAAGLTVQILSGAVVIWEEYIALVLDDTTATSQGMGRVAMSGLNLACPENESLTIQFSAAGGGDTFESVNLSGFVA